MLSRLNPISAVRFLVFVEICLLVWHPASRFNSWSEINASLENSIKQEQTYNAAILKSLKDKVEQPASHDRVYPFWMKAVEVTKASELITLKIDSLKSKISSNTSSIATINTEAIKIMFLVDDLRDSIMKNVRSSISDLMPKKLPVGNTSSYIYLFKKEKLLTVHEAITNRNCAVGVLASLQNDVVASTAIFTYEMYRETLGCVLGWRSIDAIAVPYKSYYLPGEKVKAKIMMVDYDMSGKPEIAMNEGTLERTENGIAAWSSKARELGWHTVSGNITVHILKPDTNISKPYSFKYFVGEPNIQLYVKDQNFIYANVPSPVKVEGHGYVLEDMSLVAPGAEVTSISPGHFEVLVNGPHKAAITAKLMAKDKTGKMVAVDAMMLNIIDPPLPVAGFGTNTGGPITVDYLRQHDSLNAQLRDDDIVGMQPVITQYEVSYFSKENLEEVGPYMIRGRSLDYQPAIKQVLLNAKKGDRITINAIKCRYLDGRLFSLNPCSYIIE